MDTELGPAGSPEGTLDYKVTGRRIVAALIDLIPIVVLFVVMAAAFGTLGKTTDEEGRGTMYMATLHNGPFVLYCLLVLGYFVLLETVAGGTLGKMVLGLRVVKVDGSPCDWKAIIVRNLVRIVDWIPLLYAVGLVSVAVTDKKQRLGDKAAGTAVVRCG